IRSGSSSILRASHSAMAHRSARAANSSCASTSRRRVRCSSGSSMPWAPRRAEPRGYDPPVPSEPALGIVGGPRSRAHGGGVMPLEVGFGSAVITPPTPVQLAGFAEDQPATEVHDDLEVHAVYARGEHGAVCLVVCDLLGMSARFADPVRD